MRTPKPRPRKKANPLTELRQLLGSDARPLSMSKLALLADIPAATLRSVEIGRRTFNQDLQRRMRRRGLEWQPKDRRWRFTFGDAELSLALLESFRRLSSGGSALLQDLDAHALATRLVSLMQNVEPTSYRSLLLDLHDSLESFREVYRIEGAQEDFRETTPWYKTEENDAGGQKLIRGYSWKNSPEAHQLLDLTDRRKSHVVLETDEQGDAFATITQPAA
jgi:hypothetical protein